MIRILATRRGACARAQRCRLVLRTGQPGGNRRAVLGEYRRPIANVVGAAKTQVLYRGVGVSF
jgi:hypothetical protein